MSAIAAIIRFDGAPIARDEIEAMTASQAHRGGDGVDHWHHGSVALGHVALHTTPESQAEQQPLTNEDDTLVLVMDGRVDNWEELRAELRGRSAHLRDLSDAELVLRSYETWGDTFLVRIDGDFALVLWDARRQRVICARDRFGMKPLHYHWDGDCLTIASELPAILERPWVPERRDNAMIAQFLSCDWTSRTATLWQDILRLDAAHALHVEGGRADTRRYWSPPVDADLTYTREDDYIAHYRSLLDDVVRRQSRSFAPVACEVSGGLDSSAVFGIADHLQRGGNLPAPDLRGYTLTFKETGTIVDELDYARSVAGHLGRSLHEVPPSRLSLEEIVERSSNARDFVGFPNSLMQLGIRQLARSHGSRVLLTGQGGDEWTTGNLRYYAETLADGHWGELGRIVRRDSGQFGIPSTAYWFVRHGLYPLLPERLRRVTHRLFRENRLVEPDTHTWLASGLPQPSGADLTEAERTAGLPWHRVGQRERLMLLASAQRTILQGAMERDAAASGIELRDPLFSRTMVEFAFSTRLSWLSRGRDHRHLHRQTLKSVLPEDVRLRRTEAEFSVTYNWYHREIENTLAAISPDCIAGFVDAGHMQEVMKQVHTRGRTDLTPISMLWNLILVQAIKA